MNQQYDIQQAGITVSGVSNHPNYQNQALSAAPGPIGEMTSRISRLADNADEMQARLRRILNALRTPPPEVEKSVSANITPVSMTIDDHLRRHERAAELSMMMLNELGALL